MNREEALKLLIEVAVNKHCPRDTDGDGDCGRPACKCCGDPFQQALAVLREPVPDGVLKEALDIIIGFEKYERAGACCCWSNKVQTDKCHHCRARAFLAKHNQQEKEESNEADKA